MAGLSDSMSSTNTQPACSQLQSSLVLLAAVCRVPALDRLSCSHYLLSHFVRSPFEVKGIYLQTHTRPSMASDAHEAFEVVPVSSTGQTPAENEHQQNSRISSEYTNFNVSGSARLHAGNVYGDVHNHC